MTSLRTLKEGVHLGWPRATPGAHPRHAPSGTDNKNAIRAYLGKTNTAKFRNKQPVIAVRYCSLSRSRCSKKNGSRGDKPHC